MLAIIAHHCFNMFVFDSAESRGGGEMSRLVCPKKTIKQYLLCVEHVGDLAYTQAIDY